MFQNVDTSDAIYMSLRHKIKINKLNIIDTFSRKIKKCLRDSTPKYRVDPKPQNTVCCLEEGQNNNPDSTFHKLKRCSRTHAHKLV